MTCLVSVITPCYNSAAFVADTIESVLAQSEPNWEMIIVDDGSTDQSQQIIASYAQQDSRIKLVTLNKNSGTSKARNIAIQHARGRYIAFLDSDDLWLPDKLAKHLKFIQKNNLALSYTAYRLIDKNNHHLGVFTAKPSLAYTDLLKTCSIGCLTVIYDTQKLGKVYFPDIKKREDYVLWLNILKQINTTQGMLAPLSIYRIHNNTLSSNKMSAAIFQWRVYRKFAGLNWFSSVYYFCHYAYFGLTKYRR